MSTMQAFHKWLSSTPETTNRYQHSLLRLTLLNRKQVLKLVSGLTWFFWDVNGAGS